jgi:hypothetical protein
MPNISSDTLFHFTPRPDYLFQILQHEFKPRYYPELIKLNNHKPITKAIPMVCFCDIPLSQIKNHVTTYGDYGIGMSRKWALKNKLNPVVYVQPNSKLSASFLSILKTYVDGKVAKQAGRDGILNVFRYLKNYQGDFVRAGKTISDIKFYNEREWRYTPDISDDIMFWLNDAEFANATLLANSNDAVGAFPLSFEPDDIKYIIIKNEGEIPAMITALKRIKSKYPQSVIENLVSRILTTDQIKKDF